LVPQECSPSLCGSSTQPTESTLSNNLVQEITMTGPEIAKAIRYLERARSDEKMNRMKQYDEEVYYPALRALIGQCPHEPMNHWRRNGIGWSWLECKFCGHTLDKGSTEVHGGILD
jgi:hypothetical protein